MDLFKSGAQKTAERESAASMKDARARQAKEDDRLAAQEEQRQSRLKRQRKGRMSLMSDANRNPETRTLG